MIPETRGRLWEGRRSRGASATPIVRPHTNERERSGRTSNRPDGSAKPSSLTIRPVSFRTSLLPKEDGAAKGRAGTVSTYTVQPGARMLWCLRRRTTDVRCIMYPNGMPVEVQVVQDRDLVLTELFQEEWLALNWAQAYCARLKQQGWQDSPSQ